jgi:tetratricopeptide (TPR) repeat protein
MAIDCTFHRAKAAHFHCIECGTAFCENCVSTRKSNGFSGETIDFFCPGCNIPAELLSLGNIIKPFWNNLGSFFLYPFQMVPLLLTIVLSALGAIFPSILLVSLFVWVVMMKYAYATLIETGQGRLKAPDLSWKLVNEDIQQVLKQYVIFGIIVFIAGLIFSKGGFFAGGVFLVLVFVALPAIIMLLVATNSVVHALNPVLFFGMISRIGGPYFLMHLFLFFLLAGPATVIAYLPPDLLPLQLYVFLTLFLKQFYALICYRMMGYVLLQYHKEIGYQVDYQYFRQHRGGIKKKESPDEELNRGLAILIKQGKYVEALDMLYPQIKGEKPSIEHSEKFFKLLKMAGENDNAAKFAVHHLDLLVASKKKQKAVSFYLEMRSEGANMKTPETLLKIGQWLQDRNDFKEALAAYIYFTKRFKNHALQPEVYFELARLLHEQANNSAKAQQILKVICKSYPQHRLIPEVSNYLSLIDTPA